jgi:hypothetical protein
MEIERERVCERGSEVRRKDRPFSRQDSREDPLHELLDLSIGPTFALQETYRQTPQHIRSCPNPSARPRLIRGEVSLPISLLRTRIATVAVNRGSDIHRRLTRFERRVLLRLLLPATVAPASTSTALRKLLRGERRVGRWLSSAADINLSLEDLFQRRYDILRTLRKGDPPLTLCVCVCGEQMDALESLFLERREMWGEVQRGVMEQST